MNSFNAPNINDDQTKGHAALTTLKLNVLKISVF